MKKSDQLGVFSRLAMEFHVLFILKDLFIFVVYVFVCVFMSVQAHMCARVCMGKGR